MPCREGLLKSQRTEMLFDLLLFFISTLFFSPCREIDVYSHHRLFFSRTSPSHVRAPSHFHTDVCSTQAYFSSRVSLDFQLKNETKTWPLLPRRRRRTRLGVNDRFDRYVTDLLLTVAESGAILIQHAPLLCVRFLPFSLSHYFSHLSLFYRREAPY